MTIKLFQTKGGKQILGGVAGMIGATLLYVAVNQLPFSKALLIDTSSPISENAHQVRVSDKTIDDENLRAIATRAAQVSATLKGAAPASISSSASSIVASDNSAWLAMRETQRQRAATYGAAPKSSAMIAGVNLSSISSSRVRVAAPVVQSSVPSSVVPVATSTKLADSGPLLNVALVVSLVAAFFLIPASRKHAAFAALKRAF